VRWLGTAQLGTVEPWKGLQPLKLRIATHNRKHDPRYRRDDRDIQWLTAYQMAQNNSPVYRDVDKPQHQNVPSPFRASTNTAHRFFLIPLNCSLKASFK
jgi:hypothetical protein